MQKQTKTQIMCNDLPISSMCICFAFLMLWSAFKFKLVPVAILSPCPLLVSYPVVDTYTMSAQRSLSWPPSLNGRLHMCFSGRVTLDSYHKTSKPSSKLMATAFTRWRTNGCIYDWIDLEGPVFEGYFNPIETFQNISNLRRTWQGLLKH